MGIAIIMILIIAGILVSIFLTLFWFSQKQNEELRKEIDFIIRNNTNLKLTLTHSHTKEAEKLVDSMNHLLEKHRQIEMSYEKSNHYLKQTITNLSHDLRTPLTSANGYLQMLNQAELPEEKRKEYLKIVQDRINTLQILLEDLFEFARLETQELNLEKEEIEIGSILSDTISKYYYDFKQKGIEPQIILPKDKVWILGDEKALQRVFQNLIQNSKIHGKGDLCITLTEGKKVYFQNHTESIEKQDITRIFERFYTTDKSRTKKTTGLGLTICKKLVEKMNGKIEAILEEDLFTIKIQF